jgi:bacterioferritin-associated ferredoxin
MYVCLCRAVSDTTIVDAIRDGADTVDAVGRVCVAGTHCGKCRTTIEFMILREQEMVSLAGREQRETPP